MGAPIQPWRQLFVETSFILLKTCVCFVYLDIINIFRIYICSYHCDEHNRQSISSRLCPNRSQRVFGLQRNKQFVSVLSEWSITLNVHTYTIQHSMRASRCSLIRPKENEMCTYAKCQYEEYTATIWQQSLRPIPDSGWNINIYKNVFYCVCVCVAGTN